jgi:hypothetical protein
MLMEMIIVSVKTIGSIALPYPVYFYILRIEINVCVRH